MNDKLSLNEWFSAEVMRVISLAYFSSHVLLQHKINCSTCFKYEIHLNKLHYLNKDSKDF